MTIELDINESTLGYNDKDELMLKITENPAVHFTDDGLFVDAPPGEDTPGGTGYTGKYDSEGLRLGANCPFGSNSHPDVEEEGIITCTNIVHKVFESRTADGSDLIGFRNQIDCTFAGDMYRVSKGDGTYDYYLITETEPQTATGQCGNMIRASVLLGSW